MEKIKLSLSSYSNEDLDELFASAYKTLSIIRRNEMIEEEDYEKQLEYVALNDFYGSAFKLINAIMNEEANRINN